MSNTFNIWDDWKKRIGGIYTQAEEGLLGEVRAGGGGENIRVGGITGRGEGLFDQSKLSTAGGVINEALLGKQMRTRHPTEGTLVGVGGVPQMHDPDFDVEKDKWVSQGRVSEGAINWTTKKTAEITKGAIEKGGDILEHGLNWAFPNAEWAKVKSSISSDDKAKLSDMIKSGKIDHGFVNALKKKASPLADNELSGIEKLIGVSKEDVAKQWKDKGGFEGLMSNPAFTLGLALMQSSAEGKSIGQGAMDNFISAAKLSEHYKDRIDARTQVIGPPTKEERKLAAGALQSIGISGPGWGTKAWDFVKVWGKDNTAAYNAGLNKIIIKSKEIIKKKYKYKKHQITEQDYIDAFKQLQSSGELGSVENIFSVGIKDMKSGKTKKKSWAQKQTEKIFGADSIFFRNRAEGGPVQAGEPYIVGEKGPEVVVPNANATVVSNDDSQIMSMLLSSNPQLQNVSRTRAESILRSRFPDYFA